ncbi:MAG TPA: hypothetical protein DGG94_02150, partial [Micromonosporaceae bacterium]|nr:hypothetical protein [Micromonosporaceae bacterium]
MNGRQCVGRNSRIGGTRMHWLTSASTFGATWGDLMLRIHFTAHDLARMKIAAEPDPLWEVLLSLHMAQSSGGELIYGNWRRNANTTARQPDLVLLRELAPPNGYSPDFLTPPAAGSDLDEALDHLLSTPRTDVRAQLDYLASRRAATPWTRALASGKSDPMRRLGYAVRSYHETAIAPYWRSIRGHVVADRARRVQQWTSHGVDHFLANLHPRVRWTPPVLQIFDFVDTDVYLDGR